MSNVDSINRLIDELENDEEMVFMKEESGLEEADEKAIIESFTRRANLFDNSGIFIPYEEWKEIFFQVADLVTFTDYQDNGEVRPKAENLIPETVNSTILERASVKIPEDIFSELEDENELGGGGRHF